MTEVDQEIEERLKILQIEEKQKSALKVLDDLVKQIDKKNEDMRTIKEREEKALSEIEKVAGERVAEALMKMTKVGEKMADLEGEATITLSDIKIRAKRAQDAVLGLLQRAKEIVEKADRIMNQSEQISKITLEAQKTLEHKTLINSEFEKVLKGREKEVEEKDKEASRKLQKAKDLAFWHKEPESTYKQE